ncbi:MAG: citrate/2-methylcitrate synthase [Planctomycetaceae bacterium]
MALELFHPGLAGVIAGETDISGTTEEFVYRGYPVRDLVDGASFLEVAHLLLTEELPSQEQLADFRSLLWEDAALPDFVVQFVQDLPLHVGPLDMLQTGISLLGNCDPQLGDPNHRSGVSQAIRLLARVPLLLGEWRRLRDGRAAVEPTPVLSYSGNVLFQLSGCEPSRAAERAFAASLIVSADYGFDPSTFVARVAASAGANVMSAVTAAVTPLVHGATAGRYSAVLELLAAVGTCANAERWVKYRVGESLPLPGFSFDNEPGVDPRAALLKHYCRELAEESGAGEREDLAAAVETSAWEAARRSPTLEWPAARLYEAVGIDRDLHTAAFVCGRLAGWCAHAIEQTECAEAIQPRSRYRGAERLHFEPLILRG